jgi:hypothetical protein
MKYLLDVFFSPSQAFKSVKEREVILLPIIIVLLVVGGASFIISPIAGQDKAQLMSQNPELSEQIGEEQLELIRNPTAAQIVVFTMIGLAVILIVFLLNAFLIMLLLNITGGDIKYKTAFSAVLTAALIDPVLSTLFKTPVILAKGTSLGVSASLALLMPDLPITSTTYMMLAAFDLFSIWALIVLIIGISVLADIKSSKSAFICGTVWVILNAIFILLSSISN